LAFVVQHGQPELLHVVRALHPSRRLSCRLHGRKQQRDQDADDRDDHEQFHEGKTVYFVFSRLKNPAVP